MVRLLPEEPTGAHGSPQESMAHPGCIRLRVCSRSPTPGADLFPPAFSWPSPRGPSTFPAPSKSKYFAIKVSLAVQPFILLNFLDTIPSSFYSSGPLCISKEQFTLFTFPVIPQRLICRVNLVPGHCAATWTFLQNYLDGQQRHEHLLHARHSKAQGNSDGASR